MGRDKEHWQISVLLLRPGGQHSPHCFWHHHVANQHANAGAVRLAQQSRLMGPVSHQDLVVKRFKIRFNGPRNVRVIVHQQHGFALAFDGVVDGGETRLAVVP